MATTRKSSGTNAKRPAGKRATTRPAKTAAAPAKATKRAPAKARSAAGAESAAQKKRKAGTKADGKARSKPVRDSFTMPQPDFGLIAVLKERAIAFQRPAKKSELLRAGLHALVALDDAALRRALDELAPVKSGRPRKA